MSAEPCATAEQVARIVRQALEEGAVVEIDGLGIFRPHEGGGFEFVSQSRPQVFIAYVHENYGAALRLFNEFRARGYEPWLDKKKLLPGQNWPRAIEQSIEVSDFFVACFSRRSVSKKGHFQSELRYALDCAGRVPLDEVYFIPARLEECSVPARIPSELQYVDLFPDWERGVGRILSTMETWRGRRGSALKLAR